MADDTPQAPVYTDAQVQQMIAALKPPLPPFNPYPASMAGDPALLKPTAPATATEKQSDFTDEIPLPSGMPALAEAIPASVSKMIGGPIKEAQGVKEVPKLPQGYKPDLIEQGKAPPYQVSMLPPMTNPLPAQGHYLPSMQQPVNPKLVEQQNRLVQMLKQPSPVAKPVAGMAAAPATTHPIL